MKKEATSYRLTPEVKRLIKVLADRLGINETSVIERLVREEAEKRGINMQDVYEVRVIRVGREFKAWEGSDEQLSKEQYELWKRQENVEKVGRFVNGEWAEPAYIPQAK